VSDLHLRILRLVAHRNQRELDAHNTTDPGERAASTARRHDLAQTAARTRARLAAAHARRRYHPPDHPS
jgi:hypothetical protein